MEKQSEICPYCMGYMEYVKENQWLKCPTCGFMKKVIKRIITYLGIK